VWCLERLPVQKSVKVKIDQSTPVCSNVDRYDESLWKGALDLSGKKLKNGCVNQLLDRGVSVLRLARVEVLYALVFLQYGTTCSAVMNV